jgi:hypothetical protein
MTVKELITKLEAIENKDLDVVINSDDYGNVVVTYISQIEVYYGRDENTGWYCDTRECVLLE